MLLPVTAAGLWWLGRIRVAVTDGELLVDDARLPVRFVADVVALDAAGRREVLGVGADPLAFVVQRPWIGGAVQVVLDDPADPTPFWVVSTRHPVELAAALLAARTHAARRPYGRRAGLSTGDGAAGQVPSAAGQGRRWRRSAAATAQVPGAARPAPGGPPVEVAGHRRAGEERARAW